MSSKVSAMVAEQYAEALMSIAQSNNLTELFGQELRSLLVALNDCPELGAFLTNPVLNPEDKKAVIRRLVGEQNNPYFLNFLLLLVDRRRIMFIGAIGEKYLEILRKFNNTVLALVTSAVELNESQRQTVIGKVQSLTGARAVELKTVVDPDLLGGLVIKVGSQVFDTSLRGQLRRIGISLMSA